MKKNFLITFIIGTRPEAIKLASVIKAFNNSEIFNSRIILTGQHKEMVNEILEIWKIKPSKNLEIMLPNQTLNYVVSNVIQKLNEDKLKPAFAKKAKDVIEKVLGTNVEYDGENVFTAKGKRAAEAPLGTIFIDYYKHPLYGDTFTIFSTMSGVTGTEEAENSRDALKALIKFTKKNKRTFLK